MQRTSALALPRVSSLRTETRIASTATMTSIVECGPRDKQWKARRGRFVVRSVPRDRKGDDRAAPVASRHRVDRGGRRSNRTPPMFPDTQSAE